MNTLHPQSRSGGVGERAVSTSALAFMPNEENGYCRLGVWS